LLVLRAAVIDEPVNIRLVVNSKEASKEEASGWGARNLFFWYERGHTAAKELVPQLDLVRGSDTVTELRQGNFFPIRSETRLPIKVLGAARLGQPVLRPSGRRRVADSHPVGDRQL